MPIRGLYVVSIEFAGAALTSGGPQPAGMLRTRGIRLVESRADQGHTYTLYDGASPEYTLSVEETEHLEQLLGGISVKAPWQGVMGLDGADNELTLRGAMSSITFRWWMDVPPEWKQVGAVFDYVMAVADRRRATGT